MTTALVTGATAGIGAEFAKQLAAQGNDLILVARDATRLQAAADQLRTSYGVQAEVLAADLNDRGQLQQVADRISDAARPVDIVVNNAGFGMKHRFLDNDVEQEERMQYVLCTAVMVLSHAAGRAMRDRGRGRIINVASMAAFMASGSYAAAKSYVMVLSESLATELSGTGVSVTVVCPGFTHTEFHERMDLNRESGVHPRMWLQAQDVVAEALAGSEQGQTVVIPGMQYKVGAALLRHVPRRFLRRPSRSRRD